MNHRIRRTPLLLLICIALPTVAHGETLYFGDFTDGRLKAISTRCSHVATVEVNVPEIVANLPSDKHVVYAESVYGWSYRPYIYAVAADVLPDNTIDVVIGGRIGETVYYNGKRRTRKPSPFSFDYTLGPGESVEGWWNFIDEVDYFDLDIRYPVSFGFCYGLVRPGVDAELLKEYGNMIDYAISWQVELTLADGPPPPVISAPSALALLGAAFLALGIRRR